MATTINASTSGLIETSDGTAVLALQTGGTTAVTINATQALGVGSSPSYGTSGQFLTSGGSGAAPTWTSGGSGTVISVGWTGGIVSVGTATTTPAFTIAGTSGGIPYFSSGTTWASSAALTQYGIVYGGGAGGAPVATAAGTTGQFLGANTGGAPTWQTPSGGGSPGGTNTQVQYNNSSAFGGISGFTTDGTRVTASTTIGVGGATPSTSGSGISFPATQSASSNVNTLDDYEEGSWTATDGSGAGLTFTTYSSTKYTKVGQLVTITGIVQYPATANTSNAVISGLPFPSLTGSTAAVTPQFSSSTQTYACLYLGSNVSNLLPYGTLNTPLTNANCNNILFQFSLTYPTST